MNQSSGRKFRELSDGFHIKSSGIAEKELLLQSQDEWEVLTGILLSCQSGRFDELTRIPDLMRKNESFLFWKAATELVGYAGSWGFIRQFFEEFQNKINDRGVQYFLSISLANSYGLWAVEPLLRMHALAVEEDPRYQIERHLSHLLEEENDFIWAGAEEKVEGIESDDIVVHKTIDFKGFAEEVRFYQAEIIKRIGSTEKPIYGGKLLDIVYTAEILYDRLTSNDKSNGRIYRELMMFEATTGIDCNSFSDKDLNNLHTIKLIKSFLKSDTVKNFEPGKRYFFGHPISG